MEIHPIVTITYYTLLILFTALMVNPWTALVCIVVQLFILGLWKGPKAAGKALGYTVTLTLLFTAINAFLNQRGNTPLLFINEVPVTLESMVRGALSGGLIAALVLVFQSAACFIDNGKLLFVIGRVSPTAALMVCMTLRFIPYYGRQLKQLKETQQALGYNTHRAAVKLFWAMLSENLETSIETQHSMQYRGYGSEGPKNHQESRYHFTGADTGKMVVVLLMAAGILLLLLMRVYEYTFFPYMQGHPGMIWGVALYGIFSILPIIYKIWEEIAWKRYTRLKI